MQLLLITSKRNYTDYDQLVEYLKQKEVTFTSLLWTDITFDNFVASCEKELLDAQRIIMRASAGRNSDLKKRELLLTLYPQIVSKTLNGETYSLYPNFSKIDQLSIMKIKQLPFPHSYYLADNEKLPLPVVAKYIHGSGGLQVHLVESNAELENVQQLYPKTDMVYQQVLPIGEDYRFVVLGGKVVASHKKINNTGFVTNITSGGTAHPVESSKKRELENLAIKACEAFNCEYAGIDIMYDNQQRPLLLELNRAPGMNVKQYNVWKLNLAHTLIDYLLTSTIDNSD